MNGDGGPFRTQRPATGQSATHRKTAQPRHEEAAPAPVEPARPTPRPSHTLRPQIIEPEEPSLMKKLLWPIITVIILIVGLVGGYFSHGLIGGNTMPINTSQYQAIFLTNGQVYFGKLSEVNDSYVKLTNVFYLQSQQGAEGTSGNPQDMNSKDNVQLVKLGKEIHGPEDEMVIAKDQMLFFENLKSDGTVAKSIAKYQGE